MLQCSATGSVHITHKADCFVNSQYRLIFRNLHTKSRQWQRIN